MKDQETEKKDHQTRWKKQIETCCTWGKQLADKILTYQIDNAEPENRKLIVSALNYW